MEYLEEVLCDSDEWKRETESCMKAFISELEILESVQKSSVAREQDSISFESEGNKKELESDEEYILSSNHLKAGADLKKTKKKVVNSRDRILLNRRVKSLPNWIRFLVLLLLFGSVKGDCDYGKDSRCPSSSFREITAVSGEDVQIGTIPDHHKPSYQLKLNVYESGVEPFKCCVIPWGSVSCTTCSNATLGYERNGSHLDITLLNIRKGLTFHLKIEGPVFYHSYDGIMLVPDNENPVISGCPSDQSVNTDSGNYTAVVTWTPPTATDNSGSQMLTSTNDPGDYFPVGNTPVTYTSIDGSLNTETCTFHVHVIDVEPPMIFGCPSDQNVNTDSGNDTAVVTWTPPTAIDNSGSQLLTTTNDPGDYFPVGNTPVTYTSIDGSLNKETCTFHVHVTDVEPPMIFACPSDQSVNTDSGNATALVTWTPPTATDNSGFQALTFTYKPGDFFRIGNNTVTYTSTDAAGNTETCNFYIHVTDVEPPMIFGCPSDQSVNTDSGNDTAVVTWTPPTATDNSGCQMLTSTNDPGDYFPIGNNTVTYTSTDAAGNTETCNFYIHVTGLSTSGKGLRIPLLVLLVLCNLVVGVCYVIWILIKFIKKKRGLSTSGKWFVRIPIPLLVLLVLCNLFGVCYVIWILIKSFKKKRDERYRSVPTQLSPSSPTQPQEQAPDQVPIDVEPDPNNENLQMRRL